MANSRLIELIAGVDLRSGRGRRRRRPGAGSCLLPLVVALVGAHAALAQQIVTDGRTQTNLSINANVTDVTTSTINGHNAFNSFSKFNVDTGNTVNLHLPGTTSNLINIVTGQRSDINGTLNSIKNNQVGGNVYFANPHGVVVGAGGVVNVGALSVTTPPQEFVDGFFDAAGQPSGLATQDLIDGKAPLGKGGLISIGGSINATGDISLSAGTFVNTGTIQSGAVYGGVTSDFSRVVNINGHEAGTAIATENGEIVIRAAGDVTNTGHVATDGANELAAGKIRIDAGRDVNLGSGGVLSARGRGNASHGGSINVWADGDAAWRDARVDVRGGEVSGDGGFAEFSAAKTVAVSGAQGAAAATKGRAGRILIDPDHITFSGTNAYFGDQSFEAKKSITIAAGTVISTRDVVAGGNPETAVSVGNSGDLELIAPKIEIKSGAKILTHVEDGSVFSGGDIKMIATNEDLVLLLSDLTRNGEAEADLDHLSQAEIEDRVEVFLHDLLEQAGPLGTKKTSIDITGALLKGNNISLSTSVGNRLGFVKGAEAHIVVTDSTLFAAGDVSIQAVADTTLLPKAIDELMDRIVGLGLGEVSSSLNDNSYKDDVDSSEADYQSDNGEQTAPGDLDEQDQAALDEQKDTGQGLGAYIKAGIVDQFGMNLDFYYTKSDVTADTHIGGDSRITAGRNVTIAAEADSRATPYAPMIVLSAAWADSSADAAAKVDGTSRIVAGNSVDITSHVETIAGASADASIGLNKPGLTFSWTTTTATSMASVGADASILAGVDGVSDGAVSVLATSDHTGSALANAVQTGGSGVGLAAAVHQLDATTDASIAGEVVATGDVNVNSESLLSVQTLAVGESAGNNTTLSAKHHNFVAGMKLKLASTVLPFADKLFSLIKPGTFNLGGAVAVQKVDNDVVASIGTGASVKTGSDIFVLAHTRDRPSVGAEAGATGFGPAIAGAATFTESIDTTRAFIDDDAVVDAGETLSVEARSEIPYPWDFDPIEIAQVIARLTASPESLFLSTYALNRAAGSEQTLEGGASGTSIGVAAGFNWTNLNTTAEAFIGADTAINQDLVYRNSGQDVVVSAKTDANTVNASGPAIIPYPKFNSGGNAAGGNVTLVIGTAKADAYVDDGAVISAGDGGVLVDSDASMRLIDIAVAGGTAEKYGIIGAGTVLDVDNQAHTRFGKGVIVDTTGDLTARAHAPLVITNIAGGVVKTKGTSVGVSGALGFVTNEAQVTFDDSSAQSSSRGRITAENIGVEATTRTQIGAYSVSGAIALSDDTPDAGAGDPTIPASDQKGGFGFSGNASINDVESTSEAAVEDGWDFTANGSVSIEAKHKTELEAAGGSGTFSADGAGIGGSYSQNSLDEQTSARFGDGTIHAGSALDIDADATRTLLAVAASLSAAARPTGRGYSIAGSVAVNTLNQDPIDGEYGTHAYLGGMSAVGGDVDVLSSDDSKITTVGGAVAFSLGSSGVGAGVAVTLAKTNSTAEQDGDVETDGNLQIVAETETTLNAAAAAIGASKSGMSAALADTTSEIDSNTLATVAGTVEAAGSLAVAANSDFTGLSIAGNIAGSSGGSSFGGSASTLTTNDAVTAEIADNAIIDVAAGGTGVTVGHVDGTSATITGVAVSATSQEGIEAFAAGGTGSGGSGVAGSVVVNNLTDTTTARAGDSVTLSGASGANSAVVDLLARDNTDLLTVAGAVAYGSSGGYGAGVDAGILNKETTAEVGTGSVITDIADFAMDAQSKEKIRTTVGGIGLSGSTGIAGAGAGYNLTIDTYSRVGDGSTVISDGNVVVAAYDDTTIDQWIGTVAGSGSTAFGASVGVLLLDKHTQASIGADAAVTAHAFGDDATVSDGSFNVSFVDESDEEGEVSAPSGDNGGSDSQALDRQRKANAGTMAMQGVAVTAMSQDDIESYAVGASASAGNAANVAYRMGLIKTDTRAYAGDRAQINQAPGAADSDQRVHLVAANDLYQLAVAGALAGSPGSGLAPAFNISQFKPTTLAYIGANAVVDAQRAIDVRAAGQEEFLTIGAGLGVGGTVGVAGSVMSTELIGTTRAYTGDGSDLESDGTVLIAAEDDTQSDTFSGSVAVGISEGAVGGVVAVTKIKKDTAAATGYQSQVTGRGLTDLDAYRGVAVTADSSERVFNRAAAGSGGFYGGIAGVVSAETVKSDTTAALGNATAINSNNRGADSSQDLVVSATNQTSLNSKDGAIGVAVGAGIGGAVDIGLIRNNTVASVGAGSQILVRDEVRIEAEGSKNVDTLIAGIGGGVLGIAGSVGVYSIGDNLDAEDRHHLDTEDNDPNGAPASSSSQGYADDQVRKGDGTSLLAASNTDELSTIGSTAAEETSSFGISSDVSSVETTGTTASTGEGVTIQAGGSVSIRADEDIDFVGYVGSDALGLVSLGAGVGVVKIDNDVTAALGQDTTVRTGNAANVTIAVDRDVDANLFTFAGGGGVFAGLNASFALVRDKGESTAALLNDVTIDSGRDVSVSADDWRRLQADSAGLAEGAVGAAGASIAEAKISGGTFAEVGSGARIGQGSSQGVRRFNVATASDLKATAKSLAVAGGILGTGAGADSDAIIGSRAGASAFSTLATLGSDARVRAAELIAVDALSKSETDARAKGYNVAAGVTVGVPLADAGETHVVSATLGSGSTIASAGDVRIKARHNANDDGTAIGGKDSNAKVDAVAVAAGAGVTVNKANAFHQATVASTIGSASNINAHGDVDVLARAAADTSADADGVSGGVAAAGSIEAISNSQIDNDVTIGSSTHIDSDGDTTLSALSSGAADADAKGGIGGLLAGGGVQGDAKLTDDTRVTLGSGAHLSGDAISATAVVLSAVVSGAADLTSGGAITENETQADATADLDAAVDLGSDAVLAGRTVGLQAYIEQIDVDADSKSDTGAVASASHSNANTDVDAGATVTVRPGVILTTTQQANVQALIGHNVVGDPYDVIHLETCADLSCPPHFVTDTWRDVDTLNVVTGASATAKTTGVTGSVYATAKNNFTASSNVDFQAGSSITTPALFVTSEAPVQSSNAGANDDHAVGVWGRYADAESKTLIKYVTKYLKEIGLGGVVKWVKKVVPEELSADEKAELEGSFASDSNIYINGTIVQPSRKNPALLIDASGNILQSDGIRLKTGAGTLPSTATNVFTFDPSATEIRIEPNPLDSGLHELRFNSLGGSVSGSGTVIFKTYTAMSFVNDSSLDLRFLGLDFGDAAALTEVASGNSLTFETSEFTANLTEEFPGSHPDIVIDNRSASDVVIAGPIYNPAGDVRIGNRGGNIYFNDTTGPFDAEINTEDLTLIAENGAIGFAPGGTLGDSSRIIASLYKDFQNSPADPTVIIQAKDQIAVEFRPTEAIVSSIPIAINNDTDNVATTYQIDAIDLHEIASSGGGDIWLNLELGRVNRFTSSNDAGPSGLAQTVNKAATVYRVDHLFTAGNVTVQGEIPPHSSARAILDVAGTIENFDPEFAPLLGNSTDLYISDGYVQASWSQESLEDWVVRSPENHSITLKPLRNPSGGGIHFSDLDVAGDGTITVLSGRVDVNINLVTQYDFILSDIDWDAGSSGVYLDNVAQTGSIGTVTIDNLTHGDPGTGEILIKNLGNDARAANDVVFNGVIDAPGASVKVDSYVGDIRGGAAGHLIRSASIDLNARAGSVGSVASLVRLDPGTGSVLVQGYNGVFLEGAGTDLMGAPADFRVDSVGSARGDVFIATLGSLLVGNVAAPLGNVTLEAEGSIVDNRSGTATANVRGKHVELQAGLALGAADKPFAVDSTLLSGMVVDNIYLTSTNGFNLGRLQSISGDVSIVAAGGIVDGDNDPDLDLIGKALTLVSANQDIRGLEINSNGPVTLQARSDIDVQEVAGDLLLKSAISTQGNTTLTAQGSILDVDADAAADVVGDSITLTVGGQIGTAANRLEIDSNYLVTLTGNQGVFVEERSGDLVLASAVSTAGDVTLAAAGSIVDFQNEPGVDVVGRNVQLVSTTGSIGGGDNPNYNLEIDADALTITAPGFINIREVSGDLNVQQIQSTAGGDVTVVAAGSIVDVDNDSAADIIGGGLELTAQTGSIGSAANSLEIDSTSATLDAQGAIAVTETAGDLRYGTVVSQSLGDIVLTSASGSIIELPGSGNAAIVGGSVSLAAPNGSLGGGGILNIASQSLQLLAAGDIYAAHFGDLNLGSAQSSAGNVHLVSIGGGIFELGDDPQAEVSGNTLILESGGLIGRVNHYLEIDSGSGADFRSGIDGATSGIFVTEVAGNLHPFFQANGGDVGIRVLNGSLTAAGGYYHVFDASHLDISVPNGEIRGLSANAQSVNLLAGGDIVADFNGRLAVDSVVSTKADGQIILSASGSIVDAQTTCNALAICDFDDVDFQADRIELDAGGAIGSTAHRQELRIESGRGVAMHASGEIRVNEMTGDLNVELVKSDSGDVWLHTLAGSIVDSQGDTAADIVGRYIHLVSGFSLDDCETGCTGPQIPGSVGSASKALDIDSQTGVYATTAGGSSGIWMRETAGDMLIDLVESPTVSLQAAGSLLQSATGGFVSGGAVKLLAGTSIGRGADRVDDLEVRATTLDLSAPVDINVSLVSGNLVLLNPTLSVSGNLRLSADAGAIIRPNTVVFTGNHVSLNAGNGALGTSADHFRIDSNQASLTATQGIVVDEIGGSLNLNRATTTGGDVLLTAAGAIVDNVGDGSRKVKGANVVLVAGGGGIGAPSDDLEIDSNLLTLTASGSVYVREYEGDLNLVQLTDTSPANSASPTFRLGAWGAILDANGTNSATFAWNGGASGAGARIPHLILNAGGSVGTLASPLTVPDWADYDVSAGNGGDVAIRQVLGEMRLGAVTTSANGTVKLVAEQGGIHPLFANDVATSALNVAGGTIDLEALDGPIGCGSCAGADGILKIDSNGLVTLIGPTGIFVEETSGNLNFASVSVNAGADVTLRADQSILDDDDNGAVDVSGANVTLIAGVGQVAGSVGTSANPLEVESTRLTLGSHGSVAIEEVSGDLNLVTLTDTKPGGDRGIFRLITHGSIRDARADDNADIIWSNLADLIFESAGSIGTATDALEVDGLGSYSLTAQGDINLHNVSTGQADFWVDHILSANGNVMLTTGYENGFILDTSDGEAANIAGGSITLVGRAVGMADNPLEIDLPYSEGIGLGTLSTTTASDVHLVEIDGDLTVDAILRAPGFGNDVAAVSLKATNGSIYSSYSSNYPGGRKPNTPGFANISGFQTIDLAAPNGKIGHPQGTIGLGFIDPLRLDMANLHGGGFHSSVNITAAGNIWVSEDSGNLDVGLIHSTGGKVELHVLGAGSIADGRGDADTDVIGSSVILRAVNGNIGSAPNRLGIDSQSVRLDASNDIYLETPGDLNIGRCTGAVSCLVEVPPMIHGSTIDILVHGSVIETNGTAKNDFSGNLLRLTATGGSIGSAGHEIDLDVATVELSALGDINIERSAGDLSYLGIASQTGNVTVVAGGSILGPGSGDSGDAEITAKDLSLTARTGGLGGSFDPIKVAADTVRLDAQGDIFLGAPTGSLSVLSALSRAGDISLAASRTMGVVTIDAPVGAVALSAGDGILGNQSTSSVRGRSVDLHTVSGDVGEASQPLAVELVAARGDGDRVFSADVGGALYADLTATEIVGAIDSQVVTSSIGPVNAASRIVLNLGGRMDAGSGAVLADSNFLFGDPVVAHGSIDLLGDARTSFRFDDLVDSLGGTLSAVIDYNPTTGVHTITQNSNIVTENGDLYAAVDASNSAGGRITVTGSGAVPFTGTGTLRTGSGAGGLTILVNDSTLDLHLGDIDLAAVSGIGSIFVNGIEQSGLPRTLNGVHLETVDASSSEKFVDIQNLGTHGAGIVVDGRLFSPNGRVVINSGSAFVSGGSMSLIESHGLTLLGAYAEGLRVKLNGGLLQANLTGALDLTEINGDLNLGFAGAGSGGVKLTALGSILDGDGADGADVVGDWVQLLAGGSIGTASQRLVVDVPSFDGRLDADAGADVYLSDPSDDLRLGTIRADGRVDLVAAGSFVNALGGDEENVSGRDIFLTALAGSIGTDATEINIALGDGLLAASARDGIALDQFAGDIHLASVVATNGPVSLRAGGSILDGDGPDGADIMGDRVKLFANANLGTESGRLIVDVPNLNGVIDAASDRGDIYLSDPTGDLRIGSVKAGRRVDLLATLALVDALVGDGVNVSANSVALTALGGGIGSSTDPIEIEVLAPLGGQSGSLTATSAAGIFADVTALQDYIAGLSGPPALVYLDGLTAAQGIVLSLNGEQGRDGGRLPLDTRFIVRHDITAGDEIALLGDDRTALQVDALVESGGNVAQPASVVIDPAGHITANGVAAVLETGAVFVSALPTAATGGTAGSITITGSPAMVLSGTGTVRSHAGGIASVSIVNDSDLDLRLGDIFAAGDAASAPISVNGVVYAGGNTVINGVRVEAIAGTGNPGDGGISVNSRGGGDVWLAGRVATSMGSISIDVLDGDLLSSSPIHVLEAYALSLAAPGGALGTPTDEINVETHGGLLLASARGDIGLNGVGGDLRLSRVASASGAVSIRTVGSILDGDGADGADVVASSVRLVAGGGVGTSTGRLLVDVPLDSGVVDADVGGDLYLSDPTGDLRVGSIIAGGRADLLASGSFVDALPGGAANVVGRDVTLTASNGVIGSPSSRFTVDANGNLTLTATSVNLTEIGGSQGGGRIEATGGRLDVLVLGGDLGLDEIKGSTVTLDLKDGDVRVGRLATDNLVALLRAEGASIEVDDLSLTGRLKNKIGILADNSAIALSDERARSRGIVFDLRGNDGGVADRIEVTGVARKEARFTKLYADTALVDLVAPAGERGTKLKFKELKLTQGGVIRNDVSDVTIDALQDYIARLSLVRDKVHISPSRLRPLVHWRAR